MPKRRAKPRKREGIRHARAFGKAGQSKSETVKVAAAGADDAELPIEDAKWNPRYVKMAAGIGKLGATDRELAEIFATTDRTIRRWKLEHPAFHAALKLGKDIPDSIVERSLFNRAKGYSYEAVKLFVDKDGGEHRMAYIEHVPPDVTAQIFWLKNRRPDEWRDRQEHVHGLMTTAEDLRAARLRARDASVVAEQTACAA